MGCLNQRRWIHTTGWTPSCSTVGCLYTRYNRMFNQFDNRLYRVNGASQSDATYFTSLSSCNLLTKYWNPVYTIQSVVKPIVKPVSQPVGQQVVSCIETSNWLSTGCQTGCTTGLTTGWVFVYATGCQTSLTTCLTTGCAKIWRFLVHRVNGLDLVAVTYVECMDSQAVAVKIIEN